MAGFRLGQLSITKILEMESDAPMAWAFPEVSAEDLQRLKRWYWSDELAADPAQAAVRLSIHSFVLRSEGQTILIDSCNGNDKSRSVPFADQLQTAYLDNLAAAGVRPQQVDLVLCTHLHCDHVGWNTRLENGRWVPTFPNARYLFGRRDYEFFSVQQHEQLHKEAFEDSILPIVEAGLADMVESDHVVQREIGDGVWLEDAHGHSPGCCVVHAQRGGERALFTGDVFHHPIQFIRPNMPFFADEDSAQAVITRNRLFNEHADTSTIIFPAHFTRSSAGRIRRDGDAFQFEFLEPDADEPQIVGT